MTRATHNEFPAALSHHQRQAVSFGEGAGCEHWGFTHTHQYIAVVICSLASSSWSLTRACCIVFFGAVPSKLIVRYH